MKKGLLFILLAAVSVCLPAQEKEKAATTDAQKAWLKYLAKIKKTKIASIYGGKKSTVSDHDLGTSEEGADLILDED